MLFQLSSLSVFGPLVIFSLYNSILSQSSLLVPRLGGCLSAMAAACEKAVIHLDHQTSISPSSLFPSGDFISRGSRVHLIDVID